MYSQMTSMLYFSTAEMGMMGASPATVPCQQNNIVHVHVDRKQEQEPQRRTRRQQHRQAGDEAARGAQAVRKRGRPYRHEIADLLMLSHRLFLLHKVCQKEKEGTGGGGTRDLGDMPPLKLE